MNYHPERFRKLTFRALALPRRRFDKTNFFFFPMSCLYFAQIQSRSSCFEARACGKPDLLRINSCSCMDPICWLRCHLLNWSSMLLLHSESFFNQNVVLLQNDSPLVSNKAFIAISESSRTFPQDYGLS